MNTTTQLGRVVTDIILKENEKQQAKSMCRFRIAVKKEYKEPDGEDSEFFSVVAFGKTAININNGFSKEKQICITGRLANYKYLGGDGVEKTGVQIVVEKFFYVDKKDF